MTLSALGSLCENFTWDSRCDNTKVACCNKTTTIYVGSSMNPTIYSNFNQSNLEQAMKALESSSILVQKVKTLTNLAIRDHGIIAIRAGMCEKMRRLIAKLKNPNEETGNGQSKVRLATVLTGIDTAIRYESGTPLTKSEFRELKKQAAKVQKYYQAATYLRMIITKYKFKISEINDAFLNGALTYLKDKIVSMSKKELASSETSFWELSKYAQKTLLDASTKLNDRTLKEIQAKPELIAILLQPKRVRTASDDNAIPKVFQNSATGHQVSPSYDESCGGEKLTEEKVRTESPKTTLEPLQEMESVPTYRLTVPTSPKLRKVSIDESSFLV